MSATVAAALKKIAVAVLTDKKLRRTVLGIILGVIIIIIMPVAAVISLFNGDIEIDTDRLQTLVVENLSAEEKAKLQAVEDMMKAIETAMAEEGFTAEKAKEAAEFVARHWKGVLVVLAGFLLIVMLISIVLFLFVGRDITNAALRMLAVSYTHLTLPTNSRV